MIQKSMHQDCVVVVTARLGSRRLRRKPLIKINGQTLVQQAVDACSKSRIPVVVTSESKEVLESINPCQAMKLLTSESCKSGSERAIAAAKLVGASTCISIPCDLWPMTVRTVTSFVEAFLSSDCDSGSLVQPLRCKEDLVNASIVKTFTNRNGLAVWFSRLGFGVYSEEEKELIFPKLFSQIGLYWHRQLSIELIERGDRGVFEFVESNESMRMLEDGIGIQCVISNEMLYPINTPNDLRDITETMSAEIELA